jgi:hypothetical protein
MRYGRGSNEKSKHHSAQSNAQRQVFILMDCHWLTPSKVQ